MLIKTFLTGLFAINEVMHASVDFAREVIKIVWKARHDPVVLESAVDELELIKYIILY